MFRKYVHNKIFFVDFGASSEKYIAQPQQINKSRKKMSFLLHFMVLIVNYLLIHTPPLTAITPITPTFHSFCFLTTSPRALALFSSKKQTNFLYKIVLRKNNIWYYKAIKNWPWARQIKSRYRRVKLEEVILRRSWKTTNLLSRAVEWRQRGQDRTEMMRFTRLLVSYSLF